MAFQLQRANGNSRVGTCTGTGKPKLNAAYACKFYERGNRGIFISGHGVPRELENISMDEHETDND